MAYGPRASRPRRRGRDARGPSAAALLLLAAGGAMAADVVSPKPDAVAVTIYRDRPMTTQALAALGDDDTHGLALVVETRTIDLPAGRSRLRFEGVADPIIPQSAGVEGLPAPIIESDFDYHLLTPATLVGGSAGQAVTVVRGQTRERAIVRAAPDGVVLDIGGRIEALGCGGESERLVYDRVPPGLTAKPTLSLAVNAPAPGRYKVRLSYLTVRMNWSADYVARLSADGRSLALTGWITLANRTATTFADAPTEVVAGHLARVPVDIPHAEPPTLEPHCWPGQTTGGGWLIPLKTLPPPPVAVPLAVPAPAVMMRSMAVAARKIAIESQLGDYKLYTLAEPTTVAARQTKQVLFLDQPAVSFDRVYTHTIEDWDGRPASKATPADIVLRLDNTTAKGLGRPLPEGRIQLRQPRAIAGGRDLLLGAARLTRDTPVGEPFEIALGRATDVTMLSTLVRVATLPDKSVERRFQVAIVNARANPVTVEIRHTRGGAEGFRITDETEPHGLRAGDPVWRLTLPAKAGHELSYTIETTTR